MLATERATGRQFACKVLEKRHIVKEKKVKYVNIEKQTLNRLKHPSIVRLHCTFQDAQSLCKYLLTAFVNYFLDFVLDYAPNGELLTWIRKLGSFDLASTQFYAAEIATGIVYLHSMGVIHR